MSHPVYLDCQSVRKSYGRKVVLEDCGFVLESGEVVALVGANGSGKTTLLRCLLGFSRPDTGQVRLNQHLGYCPQDNYLDRRLTVSEHFDLAAAILQRTWDVSAAWCTSLIERFQLGAHLLTLIGNLSAGTYQKVKFVTSVLHRPELLLCDEPCDGFDWAMYEMYWSLIGELRASGAAILMITHIAYERDRFGRILTLREGRVHEG